MVDHALKYQANPDLKKVVARASEIVARISGNKLGESQAHMVESRLSKRMMELNFNSGEEYLHYLETNLQAEKDVLIGLLTTHHTFFFREFIQFEFLRTQLTTIAKSVQSRGESKIKIWSAACSRGQEVYSLAMFIDHYLPKIDPQIDFEIWGTDIDPQSVKMAQNGVYHSSELKSVAATFLDHHWAKGKDEIKEYFKAKKSLVDHIHFSTANLLELPKGRPEGQFDIIFCRNVMIYFDLNDVKKIAQQLVQSLYPKSGLLFSGVSEPLGNYGIEVVGIGPSVYRSKVGEATKVAPVLRVVGQRPLNVLCVDDSSSILSLLKKIFEGSPDFKLVATAKNGIEAAQILSDKNLIVDVMTLDIHMPEMDGISYLKKHFHHRDHPPVVMVSSAAREDAKTSLEALRLGATDFVEKPALNILQERGEEIKIKLKMAHALKQEGKKNTLTSLDKIIGREMKISHPEQKLILTSASAARKSDLLRFFNSFPTSRPPIIVLFEGQSNVLPDLVEDWKLGAGAKIELVEDAQHFFQEGKIYLGDFKNLFINLEKQFQSRPSVFCLFGQMSSYALASLKQWKNLHILVEESMDLSPQLKGTASDVYPCTSFPIGVVNFLSQERR